MKEKGGRCETQTHRGQGHAKTEEEFRLMQPPEAGRSKEEFFPFRGEHGPANTTVLNFWPSEPEKKNLLYRSPGN